MLSPTLLFTVNLAAPIVKRCFALLTLTLTPTFFSFGGLHGKAFEWKECSVQSRGTPLGANTRCASVILIGCLFDLACARTKRDCWFLAFVVCSHSNFASGATTFGETVAESQLGGTESDRDLAVIQDRKGRGHSLNSSPLCLGVPVLPVRQSDHRNHGATSDGGNAQETAPPGIHPAWS